MPVPTPPVIVKPFADAAPGTYIQNPIPDTTVAPGRASYTEGFPAITFQEKVAGGIPPHGADFNGILFAVSAHAAFAQGGEQYLFDGAVATAIGGYEKGAVLGMADGTGLWISLITANTDDPDAGSANWAALKRYNYADISTLTGGVVNVSFLDARSPVLVLTGALVSNLQLVLPNLLQQWLVVNSTTGAFTTTLRTAAGTGVAIPQGGFTNPTGVYGNGVDIFYSNTPLSISASVTPTNNSLVQRDNTGAVFGTRFDDLTAMVNTFGPRSLTANGAYALPGGFTIKWGTFNAAPDAFTSVTYPLGANFKAFTSFSRPVVSGGFADDAAQDNAPAVTAANHLGFTVYNSRDETTPCWWIAVGV